MSLEFDRRNPTHLGRFIDLSDVARNFNLSEPIRFTAEVLGDPKFQTDVYHMPSYIDLVSGVNRERIGHESFTFLTQPADPETVISPLSLVDIIDPEQEGLNHNGERITFREGFYTTHRTNGGRSVVAYRMNPVNGRFDQEPTLNILIAPTRSLAITPDDFVREIERTEALKRNPGLHAMRTLHVI